MFTIVPSLYLLSVDFFRQWNSRSEPIETVREDFPLKTIDASGTDRTDFSAVTTDDDSRQDRLSKKGRTRKKKPHHRPQSPVYRMERRRTFTEALLEDDVSYLIQHTSFTREQIEIWHREFLRDCPSGKLTKAKFLEIYQQFYKKGRVTKFCEQAFRIFDKDRSGHMDFVEFLLAVNLTSSKNPEQKIDLFFSMYDIDGNGRIDEREMHCFLEGIYELMGIDISDPSRIDSKVYDMFSKVECDISGSLSKEQFALACKADRHIRKLLVPSNTKTSNA